MDCRDCKKFEVCSCGKVGHENGTSQGYSIGECEDFEETFEHHWEMLDDIEREEYYSYEEESEDKE